MAVAPAGYSKIAVAVIAEPLSAAAETAKLQFFVGAQFVRLEIIFFFKKNNKLIELVRVSKAVA